jgi:hypothetical protein
MLSGSWTSGNAIDKVLTFRREISRFDMISSFSIEGTLAIGVM